MTEAETDAAASISSPGIAARRATLETALELDFRSSPTLHTKLFLANGLSPK